MNRGFSIQVSDAPSVAPFDAALDADLGLAADVNHDRIERQGPVCVIDDDDWVCDSLAVLLETYGFAVQAYASGTDFLADERRGRAKCIVIDQHMPGMAGLDAVAELRRQDIIVPTLLITGRLDAGIAERAAALGVRAILEKPFAVGRLIEAIRAALDSQG